MLVVSPKSIPSSPFILPVQTYQAITVNAQDTSLSKISAQRLGSMVTGSAFSRLKKKKVIWKRKNRGYSELLVVTDLSNITCVLQRQESRRLYNGKKKKKEGFICALLEDCCLGGSGGMLTKRTVT